ncbi:unnamed protein product [Paramecium pentaurelia]|uniref:Insulin-like growth factor binding protein, N-terminal n=1 Tax=Paramecium pentaurelia TaxID=43138 RepID=A0A8S1WJ55_9CILI|nr:unnamed protein product [Paramecium pentaurelia]
MISKFKQILLLILILNQSKASFQSYYWISSQTQNLNSIQWDTICSCCSFQYELCGLETILVINQCSLNDYNQIVFKTLRLQPHYQIKLTFIFWRIDEWNDYDFDVYLDYQRVHSNQYSHITSNQNICRNSLYNDELYPISITIPHTMTSITVMLVVERGIWGISQMILEAKLCPVDCESCIENQCLDQFLHFSTLVQQLVVNSSEGWLTNNQIQTTIQTFLQAKFLQPNANHLINEIELIPHQAISIQIKVLIYNSNPTEINIEIDDVLISRTQYTEGWIKYKNGYGYRSQKSISIHQYPHINDKAKISISLQLTKQEPTFSLYFAIRDFQLFLKSSLFEYPCNDDNLLPYDGCFQKNFDCIEGCSNCVRGLCLDCKVGWEYFEKEYLCIPICGDLIITFNEECDDGNNILYDGCYQCKHSCPQNCRICEFGKCLELAENGIVINNVNKVVNQSVNYAQIIIVTNVLMGGNLKIMNVINFVEMNKLLLILQNCVMMEIIMIMMVVINVNLNAYLIVIFVQIKLLVYFVNNISFYKIINVFQIVEMELLYKIQRSVKIQMTNLMMDVINVNIHVYKTVKYVNQESVYNVIKDIQSLIIFV